MGRPAIPGLDEALQINSIFCIGRNYVEHAEELGNRVPEDPVVFLKPASSIVFDGGTIVIPALSKEVHHEVELVAAIGRKGKNIPREKALGHIAGYGIGIDVTARDLQQKAKERAHPWSIAKGFDTFAPISRFVPAERIKDPQNLELVLKVNDEIRQQDRTNKMIFSVSYLVSWLSKIFTLHPGDLIFTGTPKGVSPLSGGDHITATLDNDLLTLSLEVKNEQ